MAEKKLWIVKKIDREKGTVYLKSTAFRIARWTTDRSKAKRFTSLNDIFSNHSYSIRQIDIERVYHE